MAAKPYMVRQGDVLLVEAPDGLPDGSQALEQSGSIVLAHGEATGHAHRVDESSATLFRAPGGIGYLQVRTETSLLHEEHRAVPIPPGTYRVIRQREYGRTEADAPWHRPVED